MSGISLWNSFQTKFPGFINDCFPFLYVFYFSLVRFDTKQEATEFTKLHCRIGSNGTHFKIYTIALLYFFPFRLIVDFPELQHSITTLISWLQIQKYLIPKILEYDSKWPNTVPHEDEDGRYINNNRYTTESDENTKSIYEYLRSRLDLPIHKSMCIQSSFNTLHYMFFHMRCGIYVMIRNNEVVIFCPFVNKDYTNTWSHMLNIDSENNSIENYFRDKSKNGKTENYIEDISKWWANGNIICNVLGEDNNQWWGDHFLLQLKDMLAETCNNRQVADCEFFINKRDYPHLKFNKDISNGIPVEPYGEYVIS